MSVDDVGPAADLRARSQEADVLQAQYFQRVLTVQHGRVTRDLARHIALCTQAQLANDHTGMLYERRQIRTLEADERKMTAMLAALQHRFIGEKSAPAG
jgi:hypothetical protein